jgi:hypothetical protein
VFRAAGAARFIPRLQASLARAQAVLDAP